MSVFSYCNGEFIPADDTKIHISDLALLRGYGIFDFFRVIKGKPVFLEDHLDRFERGAETMRLIIPESRNQLREIITELIKLNSHSLMGVKMILTGGYSDDGFSLADQANLILTAKPFNFPNPIAGIKLMSYEYCREVPEVKTLSYITPIRIFPMLAAKGADDFLYFNEGLISESSRSNVFIVKDQIVSTPGRNILPGITRKHIIKACRGNYEVQIRDVTLTETLEADEVFITSSNQRIIPVCEIDGRIYNNGVIGEVTGNLQDLLLQEERSILI
jgi:branched-chain amino acid aminotransferase